MKAESMLSKRPVSRLTVTLFFLIKLFSSHSYCVTMKLLLHFHNLLSVAVGPVIRAANSIDF